jgi:hypothetical protein
MPSAASVDRAAVSSALWARSFAINLLSLAACRFVLNGFELHGVWAYALAAAGIELPTLAWWLTVRLWQAKAVSDWWERAAAASRVGGIAFAVFVAALAIVLPVALATSVPGLLVAEWISPLTIRGLGTYVAASAITSGLALAFRQSRSLRFASAFIKGPWSEGSPQPPETSH